MSSMEFSWGFIVAYISNCTITLIMYAIPNQKITGLLYAGLLLSLTPISVFLSVLFFDSLNAPWLIVWIVLNCWMFTGLFITAHDSMHNSICPNDPTLNRLLGQMSLLLYAGLSYDKLLAGHRLHHQHTATQEDPDYLTHDSDSEAFLSSRWYLSFLRSYLTWHPFGWMAFWFTLFDRGLQVSVPAMLLCWILPQVLSTLQLFYFGTYLPHKGIFSEGTFPARSNDYPHWLSLLTCFHFGYHAEHHDHPYIPWWYLPTIRHARNVLSTESTIEQA